MQSKFVLLFLMAAIGLSQWVSGAQELKAPPLPSCIGTKVEYDVKQKDLPEVLQGVTNTPDGKMYRLSGFLARRVASAAINLRLAKNNKFVFDVYYAKPGAQDYFEDAYVQKMCLDGDKMIVTLENQKTYQVDLKNSSFVLENATFEPTSKAEFAKEVNDVKAKVAKEGKSSKPSGSGSGSTSATTSSSGRK